MISNSSYTELTKAVHEKAFRDQITFFHIGLGVREVDSNLLIRHNIF